MGIDFNKIRKQLKDKPKSSSNTRGFNLNPKSKDSADGQTASQSETRSETNSLINQFTYSCEYFNIESLPIKDFNDALKNCLDSKTNFDLLKDVVQYLKTICKIEKKSYINSVKAIEKYLDNIKNNPHENRYKYLKIENKVVQAYILTIPGGSRILELIGFKITDDSAFYEFKDENYESIDFNLNILKETPPIDWNLDRKIRFLDSLDTLDEEYSNNTSNTSELEEKSKTEMAKYIQEMIKESEQRKTFRYHGEYQSSPPQNTKIIFKHIENNKPRFMIAHFETRESIHDLVVEVRKNLTDSPSLKLFYCGKNILDLALDTTIGDAKLYPRVLLDTTY